MKTMEKIFKKIAEVPPGSRICFEYDGEPCEGLTQRDLDGNNWVYSHRGSSVNGEALSPDTEVEVLSFADTRPYPDPREASAFT